MRNLLVAGVLALGLAACGTSPQFPVKAAPSAVVKVLAGEGHGSGVHIGDRFIITAAHVVTDAAGKLTIKADDGSVRSATLLWTNAAYDVALLRMDGTLTSISASPLTCRDPKSGASLRAVGSPGSIEFVSTYGRMSGEVRKHGPWSSVFVFDGTVAPGMSGGPVYEDKGVAGIAVGLMAVPMGFGGALVPVSYVVPSSTICMLLAR